MTATVSTATIVSATTSAPPPPAAAAAAVLLLKYASLSLSREAATGSGPLPALNQSRGRKGGERKGGEEGVRKRVEKRRG